MPTPDILAILERLNQAYPEKRLDKHTLKIYVEELADIPASLLDQAATQIIRRSTYFPRISELRQVAQQLAGIERFSSVSLPGVGYLDFEAEKLENDYFRRAKFDIKVWDNLADKLERVGRPHRAAELREKASHIQAMISASQRGEEYLSQEARRRYAEWDKHTGDIQT